MKKKYSDTELLDWLEEKVKTGSCPGVINDDYGHWVVSFEGVQNCPMKSPADISTSFFVKKKDWCKTIRKAIIKAIEDDSKNRKIK